MVGFWCFCISWIWGTSWCFRIESSSLCTSGVASHLVMLLSGFFFSLNFNSQHQSTPEGNEVQCSIREFLVKQCYIHNLLFLNIAVLILSLFLFLCSPPLLCNTRMLLAPVFLSMITMHSSHQCLAPPKKMFKYAHRLCVATAIVHVMSSPCLSCHGDFIPLSMCHAYQERKELVIRTVKCICCSQQDLIVQLIL